MGCQSSSEERDFNSFLPKVGVYVFFEENYEQGEKKEKIKHTYRYSETGYGYILRERIETNSKIHFSETKEGLFEVFGDLEKQNQQKKYFKKLDYPLVEGSYWNDNEGLNGKENIIISTKEKVKLPFVTFNNVIKIEINPSSSKFKEYHYYKENFGIIKGEFFEFDEKGEIVRTSLFTLHEIQKK